MLTGVLPFEAPTVAGLLVKRLTEDAPPVTRRRPDCPADLAGAIARCLAREPEHRFASADALLAALTPAAGTASVTAEERRSGTIGIGAPPGLARARRTLAVAAMIALAGIAVDVAWGRVLAGPPAALVAVMMGAAAYGRLWTDGYGWRDLARRRAAGAASPAPLDSAEFGAHAAVVAGARNDRAALVALVGRYTRAERAGLGDIVAAADALLARALDAARQLHTVERQLDPGPEELERRLAATRGEPPSPGREQRVTVLEKRLEAVRGLAARREALAAVLTDVTRAVTRLRFAVERGATSGVEGVLPEVREALTGAPPPGEP
jgi:hypothetical protein